MKNHIDLLLLLALPASGKSEVRKFLKSLPPEECLEDFHIGPTIQLDDFPYVHIMRRIDEELCAMGHESVFFYAPDRPFRDPWDWGTLIYLLNEDYTDLVERKVYANKTLAGQILLDRLDKAAKQACARPKISALPQAVRSELARRLQDEAQRMLEEREAEYADSLEGKTIVIEFARGGPDGAVMPLPAPLGYAHSISLLAPEILERASILYVWVTPEESRRKNRERADPNDPGSVLHHCVPEEVMLRDYGCDDIGWLLSQSDRPGTIKILAHNRTFYIPTARMDNRVDKTSFVRKPQDQWTADEIQTLRFALKSALDDLWKASISASRL